MKSFQLVQERGGIEIEGTKFEQRGCSFFPRAALRMNWGSLDGKYSTLFLCFKQKGTIEMHAAEHTFSGSTIAGGGFIVDLFDELESFRIPAR